MRKAPCRSRSVYAALLLVTIASGLASRRFGPMLPSFIATYAGDTLWATAVFLLAAVTLPSARTWRLAAIAFGISVAVEVSQLYHAPWIDAIRGTRGGALVLGHGFLWSDLICYAVGVAIAGMVDGALTRSSRTVCRETKPMRNQQ